MSEVSKWRQGQEGVALDLVFILNKVKNKFVNWDAKYYEQLY